VRTRTDELSVNVELHKIGQSILCNFAPGWGIEGANRPGRQSGGRQIGRQKWGDEGASGISRVLGAANWQSAPGADNPW